MADMAWPPTKEITGWTGSAGKHPTPSFRGDAKHRTLNLEIPRCAIAHLRSGAKAPSRNDRVGMLVAMTSRPPDLLAAIHLSLSARERAAILFLGGGDHFQVFVGARDRRARGEDVPLIPYLVGRGRRCRLQFRPQIHVGRGGRGRAAFPTYPIY